MSTMPQVPGTIIHKSRQYAFDKLRQEESFSLSNQPVSP